MERKQVALIVLDGWGYRDSESNNAIREANTPFFDSLWRDYPHATLDASEEQVGLPSGQIGNSEVGHMTIGAGTVIDTDLVRITKAMNNGEFIKNPAISGAFLHAQKNNSTLHLVGLASDGGVHSHVEHLYGLIRSAKEFGLTKVFIHAFTDGRDVLPRSGIDTIRALEKVCADSGIARIATVTGRLYAMDRDKNWDRTKNAEEALFFGKGEIVEGKSPSEAIASKYTEGIFDELLPALVFPVTDGTSITIQKNDAVIFFNFRSDRARQLSSRIMQKVSEMNLSFVTLTEYDEKIASVVAFPKVKIVTTLANEVSKAGLTQAHIAETEKYPHATYFLNGGDETPHTGEEFVLVPSRKDVLTHDLAPEMKAKEIADEATKRIMQGVDFVFINFANADMVGHTGNKPAIIKAVETVDRELGRVIGILKSRGGVAFITADHGNAEQNIDDATGERHTAHTVNVVPAILTKSGYTLKNGGLADIAPTILTLLNLPVPPSMTGKVLI